MNEFVKFDQLVCCDQYKVIWKEIYKIMHDFEHINLFSLITSHSYFGNGGETWKQIFESKKGKLFTINADARRGYGISFLNVIYKSGFLDNMEVYTSYVSNRQRIIYNQKDISECVEITNKTVLLIDCYNYQLNRNNELIEAIIEIGGIVIRDGFNEEACNVDTIDKLNVPGDKQYNFNIRYY